MNRGVEPNWDELVQKVLAIEDDLDFCIIALLLTDNNVNGTLGSDLCEKIGDNDEIFNRIEPLYHKHQGTAHPIGKLINLVKDNYTSHHKPFKEQLLFLQSESKK